ncbi:hypothetical protein L6164_034534 [Bauhinia variegata]|uniref:Uncharacterized protein n=1 Tax=Bauhinia variegata TaxID=167791 RepID=A0ACB9KVU8_BAUVA|nr:hypothetical protein L6164_034534 [Bauhinia variegata]
MSFMASSPSARSLIMPRQFQGELSEKLFCGCYGHRMWSWSSTCSVIFSSWFLFCLWLMYLSLFLSGSVL